jgi:hypothetical protein
VLPRQGGASADGTTVQMTKLAALAERCFCRTLERLDANGRAFLGNGRKFPLALSSSRVWVSPMRPRGSQRSLLTRRPFGPGNASLGEGRPWQRLESKPAGVWPVVQETASFDSRAHVAQGVPDSLEGRIPDSLTPL